MMKKRLICIGLTLILVLSLSACGDEADAMTSFKELQKNMQNVKDAQYTMDMDISLADEETGTMTMSSDVKQVIKSKDDIEMAMDMTMDMAGNEIKSKVYMKDKAIYMDMYGEKMKVDAKDELSSLLSADYDNLLDVSEDIITDMKMTKGGDDTTYKFSIDSENAMDYIEKSAGSSKDVIDAMGDITIDKLDVKVVSDKDGMVKAFDMDCSMNAKAEEETMKMDYVISLEFKSINSGITIDFPNFKDYKEASV